MNRAWKLAAGISRRNFLAWSAAVGVAGVVGCKTTETKKVQTRSQIGEDPSDPDSIATVGSKTTVGNTESLEVSGVGLIFNLPGTGSSATPGVWRTMLEDNLRKRRDQTLNVKQLLDSPTRTTSLVIVSALIPPGARKGELIDVQVTLPSDSKTTSLQGGELFPVDLLTSDTTANVSSQVHTGNASGPGGRLLLGNIWAKAEGPLVAGNFVEDGKAEKADTDTDGRPLYRAGFISGGARASMNRPYYLLLNPNDQNPRIGAAIAERLNSTFHTTSDPNLKVADAKNRELILLNVPTEYRHNHYRFLLVARQVPYDPLRAGSAYRQKLEDELMDPSTALTAAVKLEALGGDSRRSLKIGLESASPWVRFAAAEALAYLGQTDGAAELARLAEDHPALRAQCLKALASVSDASSSDRLVEMLSSADAELRQGAFIALRLADERHPALGGKLMNRSYYLHRVSTGHGASAVHLPGSGRSEILVFGDDVKLRGPVPPMPLGTEFTVSVPGEDGVAKVTRVVRPKGGEPEVKEVACAAELGSLLTALATLGGGYSEALELVRRASRTEVLSAPLVTDAVPREMSIQQLCGFAKTDPTLSKVNVEVAKVGTVRPTVDANGFEVPTVSDPFVAPAGALLPKQPLNRDPGRLFGPKRASDAPMLDPAVVPAGGQ
ncbi:flagellar p-ring protein : Flagellar P-ring protein FlgI OS=uncultured planctomycete GN=HGMM_F16E03C17 PE=4 SV=1: FlgI: HEAT_2 [Gemmata massiliana]|uniref:Flagellar basal body P-ring protein n=1 Tax=Gemmata massiliana TaxID=1210884 RepID=A0A6P2DKB1_9BACT|nr:flagellar basal body P-ring protein FlgI [Gemmata massiliana]VTS01977.1 flagellar p-ring protein : Flagellar P-ring protein FlgI OS=uncultured planctomycete GN=HGMM_F16E03C17 PE=4 SV=1: FlgI: HEAT_2 [Gemmata massiliana]